MKRSRKENIHSPKRKKLHRVYTAPKVQRKEVNARFYFYLCSLFLLLICIGGLTMYLRSGIGNYDREIVNQEERMNELIKTKKSLAGKVDSIKSSEKIVEEAKYKLGMIYPEEEQLVYFEVKDKTEKNDVNQNVYLNPVLSVLKFFNGD